MAGLSSVAVDVVRAWRAGRGSGGPEPFQILCQERGEKGPGCTFRPRAKRVRCSLGGCAGDVTSGPAREGSLVLLSGPSGLGGGSGGGGIGAGARPALILAAESAYVTRALALGRAPGRWHSGGAPPPFLCLCLSKVLHLLLSGLLLAQGRLSWLLELSFLVGKSISVCFRLCMFAWGSRDQSQAGPPAP